MALWETFEVGMSLATVTQFVLCFSQTIVTEKVIFSERRTPNLFLLAMLAADVLGYDLFLETER